MQAFLAGWCSAGAMNAVSLSSLEPRSRVLQADHEDDKLHVDVWDSAMVSSLANECMHGKLPL